MGASRQILAELAKGPEWRGSKVAYVSRTDYPEWAEECLRLITVHEDGTSMHDLGQHQQIYPGMKTTHFKRIHKDSGIDYRDMV
jgi:magnesium-dependent phosphatase 1